MHVCVLVYEGRHPGPVSVDVSHRVKVFEGETEKPRKCRTVCSRAENPSRFTKGLKT
jgi:hypothetical protein